MLILVIDDIFGYKAEQNQQLEGRKETHYLFLEFSVHTKELKSNWMC